MFDKLFRNARELALVIGMILILIVLFSPIPPMFLDLAILVNFGLSLTMLLLTFYVAKPVEFSTFPSLLLITTLLRLSINVAATRLILTGAYAGEVINSIGSFAVGGNYVVGLVVFFILVVVQYVVVTSGAQRVSEVAARFTLDSMPGQQMSIDADLNMGLIDQSEALRRRAGLEKEASFYGAMDGASKFVKGDAVAGVIILLIDVIAGWIIGVAQMGMGWNEALQHFTLLTIGDGIATQLPALIISTSTGIIVTRSSADRELSLEVLKQLFSVPRIPLIVIGMLGLLLLLPGMPKWPLLFLAGAGFLAWRQLRSSAAKAADSPALAPDETGPAANLTPTLAIAFGRGLGAAWRTNEALLLERVANLRDAHEKALGIAFPPLQFVDGAHLGHQEYEIRIFGVGYARGEIEPDRTMAIRGEQNTRRLEGIETNDPAFGLPAVWIEDSAKLTAREAGYTLIDPLTVFITHLGEVLREEAASLLTRPTVVKLINDVRSRQSGLIEELVPNLLTISDVQRILQGLLAEGVSIAAIDLIAEHLVDLARTDKNAGTLTESLRQRMSYAICDRLRASYRDLAVMSLDPRLENQIQASVSSSAKRDSLALEPRLAERLIRQIASVANDMVRQGREPVLLCGADVRRPLRALTRRAIPRLSLLSVNEIPMNIELRSYGIVRLEPAETAPQNTRRDAVMAPDSIGVLDLQLGGQDG